MVSKLRIEKIENFVFWNTFKHLYFIENAGSYMSIKNHPEIIRDLGLEYIGKHNAIRVVEYVFNVVNEQRWMLTKIKYGI